MAAREPYFALFFLVAVINTALQDLQDDISAGMNNTETALSRKRRYLVFPEGSSLQLVFCFTMPSIGVGQIFTVGSTVALAWELPHEPFVPFREPSDAAKRVDKPEKHTSGGWTIQKSKMPASVTYMKTYYNPFVTKKPPEVGYNTITGHSQLSGQYQPITTVHGKKLKYYNQPEDHNRYKTKIQGANAYESQQSKMNNQPVTSYLHPVYHRVYRRTRRDLYTKIEKLFTGLSRDGRACLLKAICEVSKATREKGTFMEEIIKAIFRVRLHEDKGHEEKDEYDAAANKQHNCTEIYPSCEQSIWTDMFLFS